MFLSRFSNLESITLQDYRMCWNDFGGNPITHPDVLTCLHEELSIPANYFGKVNSVGKLEAAFCVWDNKFIAGDIRTSFLTRNSQLPINKDEVVLPIQKDAKLIMPWHCHILSSHNRSNILNSTFKLNASRTICLARNNGGFSRKFEKNREREVKKFLHSGGEVRSIRTFSVDELIEIYRNLFYLRHRTPVKGISEMRSFMNATHQLWHGDVLLFRNTPCAFQLIMKVIGPDNIYYDYINAGLNPEYSSYSPGSVLTWLNIKKAWGECMVNKKNMMYSFGRPTFDYKKLWTAPQSLGRVLTC